MNHLYFAVVLNPKKVFSLIFSDDKRKVNFYIPILFISIIYFFFTKEHKASFEVSTQISMLIFETAFFFITLGYLIPWILYKSGKLLKGAANFDELQLVFSATQIPISLILVLTLFEINISPNINTIALFMFFKLFVWLVSIRVVLTGISITQKFSLLKSVINIIMGLIPLVLIRFIFSLLA